MKISEPRAIIFYGDITGFTSWSRRVRRETVRGLLQTTYEIYKRWTDANGLWLKTLGDGFVAVRELPAQNHRETILDLLCKGDTLSRTVNAHIEALPFPRPGLFRMRAPLGDVWKFVMEDNYVEYSGYQMDFGRRLLDFEKGIRYVITEATFEAIQRRGGARAAIKRIELAGPIQLPGIQEEDQRNFFKFESRRARGARRKK